MPFLRVFISQQRSHVKASPSKLNQLSTSQDGVRFDWKLALTMLVLYGNFARPIIHMFHVPALAAHQHLRLATILLARKVSTHAPHFKQSRDDIIFSMLFLYLLQDNNLSRIPLHSFTIRFCPSIAASVAALYNLL